VEHARARVQFGRPIGTFQAVSHMCAEMLVDLESARSAVAFAAEVAGDPAELATAAPVAKVAACDGFARTAANTVQVHGGLGFTWDCDAQLFYKRARSSALLLGSSSHQRERLATRLGWGEPAAR
jgi:alkylation response protein AidB-like acyl-CoA dehydrogenase